MNTLKLIIATVAIITIVTIQGCSNRTYTGSKGKSCSRF